MDNENVWFRQQAGLLVDELKKPENADLLDMFIHFDAAKEDGGWGNYLQPPPGTPQEIVDMLVKKLRIKFYLSAEQSARWVAIESQFDFGHSSGGAAHAVLLVAQLMLGRLDVATGGWFDAR